MNASIRSILVPTDGSELATRALVYACRLAKTLRADLHVCYGIDYLSLRGYLAKGPESAPSFLREDGERVLEGARAIARGYGLEPTGHLIRGPAAAAIIRLAGAAGIDLI